MDGSLVGAREELVCDMVWVPWGSLGYVGGDVGALKRDVC